MVEAGPATQHISTAYHTFIPLPSYIRTYTCLAVLRASTLILHGPAFGVSVSLCRTRQNTCLRMILGCIRDGFAMEGNRKVGMLETR